MARMLDSRALAERVELGFHRRPNWFRRWNWIAGAVLGLAVTAWVLESLGSGRHGRIAAAPLSRAHQMFEHDCQRCHVPWSLLERLNPAAGQVWTVSNEKCQTCHAGPPHQPSQHPAHEAISCAACHREHRGHEQLAQVAQRLCVECHADLKQHMAITAGASGPRFAESVSRFDGPEGMGNHPQFKLHELLRATEPSALPAKRAGVPVAWRAGDTQPGNAAPAAGYHDQGRLRFNHQKHLHARYEQDQLVEGLLDANRRLVDLSGNCQACHEPEDDGGLMRPISYQRHCQHCHPLHFDLAHPNALLPHGVPLDVVRAYLVSFYASRKQAGGQANDQAPRRPDARPRLLEAELLSIDQQARGIEASLPIPDKVERAERDLARLEGRRGCRYCHDVEPADGESPDRIVPPSIPRRWFEHARFRHGSHQMLDCRECHRNFAADPAGTPVADSASTLDVLIPPIAVCRNCHASRTPGPAPAWGAPRLNPARTECVECHAYHARPGPGQVSLFRGPLSLELRPRPGEDRAP